MTSGVRTLDFLTRRHAVKLSLNASVEECSLAIGEVVGCENVLSASRMNNAIVVFLKTVELANLLVESGVVIDNVFVPVLPLSTPSKKVTLSNVPPFIKNEVLVKLLERHGRLVSPIKMIQIGCKSTLLKHVVSFRRFVYMVLKDNKEELDLTFNFNHDDFNYVVYATTNSMKCLSCGEIGHLVRVCPKKDEKSRKKVSAASVERVGEVEGAVQIVRSEVPTTVVTLVDENTVQKHVDATSTDSSGDAAALKEKGGEREAVAVGEASVPEEGHQLTDGLEMQGSVINQDMEVVIVFSKHHKKGEWNRATTVIQKNWEIVKLILKVTLTFQNAVLLLIRRKTKLQKNLTVWMMLSSF